MTKRLFFIAALVLVVLTPRAIAQTRVALKSSARADAGQPVAIADVADVAGPQRDQIIAITLHDPASDTNAGAWIEIDADRVRKAIESAGIDLRLVAVSGSSCTLRFKGVRAATPASVGKAPPKPEPQTVDLDGPPTVRTSVARRLSELLGVAPTEIKLLFDEADASFLAMSSVGRRVSVHPASSGLAERVPVRVMLFAGDKLLGERTIRVELLVRRRVVTASRTITRREEISAGDVVENVRWMPPSAQRPASLERIVGSVARGRIAAGQLIEPADIEAPVVARRGDIVVVHALCGGVHVEVRARAMGTARDGEVVELRIDGSRKAFNARMNGRGRAVMITHIPG